MALSPAFLNMTRLPEVARSDPYQVSLTIRKILADGTAERMETLAHGTLVDNGRNMVVNYAPREAQNISEIGVGGPGGYQRFELDNTVCVLEDEEIEGVYECRVPS